MFSTRFAIVEHFIYYWAMNILVFVVAAATTAAFVPRCSGYESYNTSAPSEYPAVRHGVINFIYAMGATCK